MFVAFAAFFGAKLLSEIVIMIGSEGPPERDR
jgi:hypothetical protein